MRLYVVVLLVSTQVGTSDQQVKYEEEPGDSLPSQTTQSVEVPASEDLIPWT